MASLSRVCPVCQTENPSQAAFCFGCGKPLGQTSAASALIHQRYSLVRSLGTGGFGTVSLAKDTHLGERLVAVKEMSTPGGLNAQEKSEAIEAFKREALFLAELTHPHLPRIYDHFGEGNCWYLVMDYLEGETLEAYLARQPDGAISLSEALDMGLQLCDVLAYLHIHQPPIIFRDLKPANIMRSAAGQLSLLYRSGSPLMVVPLRQIVARESRSRA